MVRHCIRHHNFAGTVCQRQQSEKPFPWISKIALLLVSRLSEELQSLPSWTCRSGPEPPPQTWFRPDFDQILTRFGPEIRLFRWSESGQNQVKIRSESGLSVGRSGFEGSVAPLDSLDFSLLSGQKKQPQDEAFGRDVPRTSRAHMSGYPWPGLGCPGQKLYARCLLLLF